MKKAFKGSRLNDRVIRCSCDPFEPVYLNPAYKKAIRGYLFVWFIILVVGIILLLCYTL